MTAEAAKIQGIYRYPVKGLTPEPLPRTRLAVAETVPGDRLYAEDARISAVVAGGIPADLRKFRGGALVPQFLGEKWSRDSVVFREASPAAYVAAGAPPVFLYHGTSDRLVPLDQSVDYQKALQAAGVVNELYLMRGLGHVTAYFFDGETTRLGADFLGRHLRGDGG